MPDIISLPGDGIDTRGVVTIFCCGTASGESFKEKYAVPYLYDRCSSDRKAILNGPGGGPIKIETNRLQRLLGMHRTGITAKTKKYDVITKGLGLLNQLRGLGTGDNVKAAIKWLQAERTAEFHTINLIGWSRGGVTCTMLAHAIQAHWEELGSPEVNIFAYDPVAGVKSGGDWTSFWNQFKPRGNADPKKLPACVKAYHAILQENIVGNTAPFTSKDKMFVCTIPARDDTPGQPATCTDYRIHALPGNHGDACLLPAKADRRGKGLAKLGLRLAVQFLSRHGTMINVDPDMRSPHILELYADVWEQFGPELATGPTRYRRQHVPNDFRNHVFFINKHHESCMFAENFHVYMYIRDAQRGRELSAAEKQEAGRLLRTLEPRLPKTTFIVSALLDLDWMPAIAA